MSGKTRRILAAVACCYLAAAMFGAYCNVLVEAFMFTSVVALLVNALSLLVTASFEP